MSGVRRAGANAWGTSWDRRVGRRRRPVNNECMSHVLFDVDDSICTITLNRPDIRNAVDGPMAEELRDAFREFEENDDLDVAVLTGAGGTFCSGADLSAINDSERRNDLDPAGGGGGPLGAAPRGVLQPPLAPPR